jgi:hypothetical protein
MEYAVDLMLHSERPFYEASVGSRPPTPYGAFVALTDAYGRKQPVWAPAGFGFIEQSGATGGRVVIRDNEQLAPSNRFRFHEDRFPQVITDSPASTSPWAAQIQSLRENLGLPITALVEALCVTRPALYSWLRGEQPNRSNQQRIRVLAEVAQAWRMLNLGPMSRHWNVPARSGGADLRSTLTHPDLSPETFHAVLKTLGIGQRLLPARASTPVLLDRSAKAGRSYARRKAWGTTGSDAE